MSDLRRMELGVVRDQIDASMRQMLASLLNKRAPVRPEGRRDQGRHGEAGFIYRPEREAQVLRRIQEINPVRSRTRRPGCSAR